MQKLLLISVIIAPIAIPIWSAREKSAHKGFKKLFLLMLAYNVFYVFALRYVSGKIYKG